MSIFRIIHVNSTPTRFVAHVKNPDPTKTNQHNQIHMSRNTSVVRCVGDGAESEEGAICYNLTVYKFHTFRERFAHLVRVGFSQVCFALFAVLSLPTSLRVVVSFFESSKSR